MNQLSPKRMFTKKLTAFHQTVPITTQQANSLLEKAVELYSLLWQKNLIHI